MKKSLVLLALTLFALSCHRENEDPPAEPDYLIFGYYTCFCENCCTTGYKISGDQLFKGEKVSYLPPYNFDSTPLEAAKYERAKQLLDDLPAQLLNNNYQAFGCGGCRDLPVYYLEVQRDGFVYKWQIDDDPTGLPAYLLNYSALLGEILREFQ